MSNIRNYKDDHTVKAESIEYLGYYGRIPLNFLNAILELNKGEQKVMQKILNMLNGDTDYRDTIGYANYRYMIKCTITDLSKALNIDRTVLSKSLKELEKHKLIKHDADNKQLFYVNPFLFNTHRLYDDRSLNVFSSEWKWKDNQRSKQSESITRKKKTAKEKASYEKWLEVQRSKGNQVDF